MTYTHSLALTALAFVLFASAIITAWLSGAKVEAGCYRQAILVGICSTALVGLSIVILNSY